MPSSIGRLIHTLEQIPIDELNNQIESELKDEQTQVASRITRYNRIEKSQVVKRILRQKSQIIDPFKINVVIMLRSV